MQMSWRASDLSEMTVIGWAKVNGHDPDDGLRSKRTGRNDNFGQFLGRWNNELSDSKRIVW